MKHPNYSSEKERHKPKKHQKGTKLDKIKIDRTEEVQVDPKSLPADAEFKGYQNVVVQNIKIETDNVRFRKAKYYSPSEGKTYLAEFPPGYEGEFGPASRPSQSPSTLGATLRSRRFSSFSTKQGS